jgi:exosortase
VTHYILNAIGFTVFKEGVVLHLANGSLEVADACSGITSLLSLLSLGSLIAYLSKGGFFKKIIIVISVIPLALIGNILRVTLFGIMLETKGILISEGFLHTTTGIGVFCMSFFGLHCIKRLIRI